MKTPFDVAKELTSKKRKWSEDIEKCWNTYMVNRILSMSRYRIDFVDLVQKYFRIPPRNIYEIYRSLLSQDARFYPYMKTELTLSRDIKLIAEHYDLSKRDARVFLNIISADALEELRRSSSDPYTMKKIRYDKRKTK